MPALDIKVEDAKKIFDVNVFAIMRLCQVFAPMLITAHGTIVMIGSLAGVIPYVFGSVYSTYFPESASGHSDILLVLLVPILKTNNCRCFQGRFACLCKHFAR